MEEWAAIETDFLKYSHPKRRPRIKDQIDDKTTINGNKSVESGTDLLQNVLDSMFDIKRNESEDYVYESHVSTVPATRIDVLSLRERLDTALQDNRARETGFCPIRRQLYDQCFDEIIRQVTVECADRGLLLYGIRNEIRMSFMATDYLHESGVAFGLRTALRYNFNESQCKRTCIELETENQELRHKLETIGKELTDLNDEKSRIIGELEAIHEQELQKLHSVVIQQRTLIDSLKRKAIDF